MPRESVTVGTRLTTQSRTITESDIVGFAGLSGDFHPAHTDEVYATRNELLKGRVAHGLLTLCISEGLFFRTNFFDWENEPLLSLGFNNVKFPNPVFPGDTISSEFIVTEIRDSKSKPGMQIVVMKCVCRKQDGEVVCEYEHPMIIASNAPPAKT